jgi:hypothetical protein
MPWKGVLEVSLTYHVPLSIRRERQEQHPGEQSVSVSDGEGTMQGTHIVLKVFSRKKEVKAIVKGLCS